jgi:hypothetical protein
MADLGAGVIILIVIWVITLALLTLFTFVQSPLRFIGFIALIIAIIVTLVLTLLPRGNNQTSVVNNTPYNYVGLARILILTFLCLTFFFGLILIFFYEILPPIYAQPIRKRFVR